MCEWVFVCVCVCCCCCWKCALRAFEINAATRDETDCKLELLIEAQVTLLIESDRMAFSNGHIEDYSVIFFARRNRETPFHRSARTRERAVYVRKKRLKSAWNLKRIWRQVHSVQSSRIWCSRNLESGVSGSLFASSDLISNFTADIVQNYRIESHYSLLPFRFSFKSILQVRHATKKLPGDRASCFCKMIDDFSVRCNEFRLHTNPVSSGVIN